MPICLNWGEEARGTGDKTVIIIERCRPRYSLPNLSELEAFLRAVIDGVFAATDRTLYLTAAMSELRHGELLALEVPSAA